MATVRPLRPRASAAIVPKLRRSDLHLRSAFVEPRTDTEQRIGAIWSEVLNIDPVGAEDDYFDLGGDSLKATEVFLELERWFGIRLAMSEILEHPTVAKLAAFLNSAPRAQENRCLLNLQTEGVGPPLFLFHDATGGVISYRHVLRRMGTRRKVFGLQYPGWVDDVTNVPPIPDLAVGFADTMRAAWPKGPYYLAGYSLGSRLAFATASHLLATGAEVGVLALIDGPTATGTVHGFRREVRKFARALFNLADVEIRRWPGYLLQTWALELKRISNKKRRRREAPTLSRFGVLFERQTQAYAPPTYPGAVKVLRSTQEHEYFNRKYLGWEEHVSGPIAVCDVAAHHGSIMIEPHAALVAAYLEDWMREADAVRRS